MERGPDFNWTSLILSAIIGYLLKPFYKQTKAQTQKNMIATQLWNYDDNFIIFAKYRTIPLNITFWTI